MLTRRVLVTALALGPVSLHAGELSGHDFAFPGLGGEPVRLADYAGGPVLVVNTASRCGYTGQYDGLQALWQRYRERGLVVIGVPSDDFGGQELDTEAEVRAFCDMNYGIDFPMTAITAVSGPSAHPFYVWAARQLGPEQAPRWNFHKYLLAPDGRLVAAFPTATEPGAPEIVEAIESLLVAG